MFGESKVEEFGNGETSNRIWSVEDENILRLNISMDNIQTTRGGGGVRKR
jgi:hypothetical protein